MTIHVIRLGTEPVSGRLRLGTVRRPPRGVPKAKWASRGFYDVRLPTLAPAEALSTASRDRVVDADERTWKALARGAVLA